MSNTDGNLGEGMIYSNPEFVDPDFYNNYNLQSSSECIDGGSPDFPNDIFGTTPDIGSLTFYHIFGCNDEEGSNYNPDATYNDGCDNENGTCCEYDYEAWYVDNNMDQ